MAGIAGIVETGRSKEVTGMLERIAHRGRAGKAVVEIEGATLGVAFNDYRAAAAALARKTVRDHAGNGHFAQAQATEDGILLKRDHIGVAPLYYGRTGCGALCFASEVKALLKVTDNIAELPPGQCYNGTAMTPHFRLETQQPVQSSPGTIAKELRKRLEHAVGECITGRVAGVWLSGGLDSSVMAALARPHVRRLHTFSAGLPGAPDLDCSRQVAEFLGCEHHEVIVSFEEVLNALPDAIYHLESFDALLVRSSIMNFLVGRAASEYVGEVFSGEGGDELFAGYEYLKTVKRNQLADELVDITTRLHNTALQRVDRSASAHGIVAHVCFLDPDVVDYAFRIPVKLKLRDGVEKWILRQSMAGTLPERVLTRRKAKFWEGAGVGDILARHAEKEIPDAEFRQERMLSNGWALNTKEELLYYRIFRGHFGDLEDLDWMGRTKGAPCLRHPDA